MQKYMSLYKVIKAVVKLIYPKTEISGISNLPDEPCIIVGNHTQIHGPLVGELYMPENCYTWCAGEMMKAKTVAVYAYKDFWSQKPTALRPIYKFLSYIIVPLAVIIFNNARTIAVYHDSRALSTFKNTVKFLEKGKNILIFPEYDKKYNNIIYDFQDRFIDVARLYRKKTGKEIKFVPFYIAPTLKKAFIGKPVEYNSESPVDIERRRICNYLMTEITNMAAALPIHTVTPYRNIPKRLYPKNIPIEVYNDETSNG